ncbi:MAG TPA: hypothetical protein VIA18_11125 [Polyangia bacterium]|nr:hypothetical protein [Polyangia bacterium]
MAEVLDEAEAATLNRRSLGLRAGDPLSQLAHAQLGADDGLERPQREAAAAQPLLGGVDAAEPAQRAKAIDAGLELVVIDVDRIAIDLSFDDARVDDALEQPHLVPQELERFDRLADQQRNAVDLHEVPFAHALHAAQRKRHRRVRP